ncbi:Rh-like protein/ammonium transporter [Wilcoxina mikolae CBS 423.85]|nr:Rh-like protein/ammonium transporter [Wilcoxina mikolae CBS 423.85]
MSNLDNDPFDKADIGWMLICSGLVFIMVPAVALIYSGLSGKSSGLRGMWLPLMTAALVTVEWYLWGYAITFTDPNNIFWGSRSTDGVALTRVQKAKFGNQNGPKIPELVFALYQGMFAAFSASLVSGAAIGKGRSLSFLIFISLWSTFVYNPVARWTWSSSGWSNHMGALDFAGGTAVHITSGTTAAVFALFCRFLRRREPRPHIEAQNVINIAFGTALLSFGWLGFNGGSTLAVNVRSVSACMATILAGSFGGFTWCISDYIFFTSEDGRRRFSIYSFCNGIVSGLVAVTPAAGFIPARTAPIFGIVGSFFGILFWAIGRAILNNLWPGPAAAEEGRRGSVDGEVDVGQRGAADGDAQGIVLMNVGRPAGDDINGNAIGGVDAEREDTVSEVDGSSIEVKKDELDIFVLHAVVGFVGMILTGFFASAEATKLDGHTVINGGWLDHNWKQVAYQLADAISGFIYAAVLSLLILCLMETFSRFQLLSFLSPVEKVEGSRSVRGKVDDEVDIAESHDQSNA